MRGAILLASLFAVAANADTGTATVQVRYWERNGGYYEPSVDDCTDAQYPVSVVQTARSVKYMKVYLELANGTVIGQGSTNGSGNATISWSTWPWEPTPLVAAVKIKFEEANNRFQVKGPTGGAQNLRVTPLTVLTTNTAFGTVTIGSSATPNRHINLYAAAWWTWNSLADSNLMLSNFNNHSIHAFDAGTTSYNNSFLNTTVITSNRSYFPQTVGHEMGHQAVYNANSFRAFTDYCYVPPGAPAETTPCGHSPGAPEWQAAGFNEAIAEMISIRTFYRQAATTPVSCRTQDLPCDQFEARLFRAEPSIETANCNATVARHWQEMVNYLWDVYDTQNDSYGDTLQRPFSVFFDGLAAYPNGSDNRQDDEPYNAFAITDDPDGRNAADMRFVWATNYSPAFQTLPQLNNNCGNIINP